MRIAVLGLGYVGVVSAACLARSGHTVAGVDPNKTKTDLVNLGRSPIVEPGLEAIIAEAVAGGRLFASDDVASAVQSSEILFICVGTPSQPNGSLDLGFVKRVCEQIGTQLSLATDYKLVAVRSTMLPGSMESLVIPTLERLSGRKAGVDFGVCINPEFLREGTAIHDYDNPPRTVIGSTDERSASILSSIYRTIEAPLVVTSISIAELIKYVDNSWHALKVAYANEIGRIAKAMGIDSRSVMELMCLDTKLNISPAYLRPGYAFGGSCLPKDVRALTFKSREMDVDTPILRAILPSNNVHVDHALALVRSTGRQRIGVIGLSFKEGTDDLRESPVVTLVEKLLGKGYDVRIYDGNVHLSSLLGANLEYILKHIPHVGKLLVEDPQEMFDHAEVLIIATPDKQLTDSICNAASGRIVVDLAGLPATVAGGIDNYQGISW